MLLGILFIFGCEWLHSLVRKEKVFSSVNKGVVVFMLYLLLRYSRKGIWKQPVLQKPVEEALKHDFLTVELGIKFKPGVYKH